MEYLSPLFAPTPAEGTDTNQVATTEWVNDAIAAAVGGGGTVDLGATLEAIQALTPSANEFVYFTSATEAATATINPFSRGLLANSSAAAWRTSLNLAVGSTVQAWDLVLDILSSLSPATDTIPYFTDSGHGDTTAFTALGRDIVGAADQASLQAAMGLGIGTQVQAYGDNLEAIRTLPTSADTLAYWTGTGDAALTDLTPWARSWLAVADAGTAAGILGAQTHYSVLDWFGTLEPNVGDLIVGTAAGLNVLPGGAFGKILVADPAAGGGMDWQTPSAALFGLGDMANQNASAVNIAGGTISGLSSMTAGTVITSDIEATGGNISGVTITGLPNPTDPSDAATKQFVEDSIGAGTTSPELLAIASLTSVANTFPVFTGHGTATLAALAPWAGGFLGNADAASAQSYLGLTPDADIMAYDPNLVAISTLAQTKGNLMVGTGSEWDVLPVDTHDGWVLQVDSSTATGYSFVNPGTFGLSDRLTNLANATLTPGQIITYAGADDWGTITPTAFGTSVLTSADADTFRAGMGLRVNYELQGHSAILDQVSGWTPAKGDLLVGGDGSVQLLTVSDDDKVLVCDSTSPNGLRWKDLSLDNTLPAALNALNNLDTTAGGMLHYSGLNEPDLVPISGFAKDTLFPLANSSAWRDALGVTIDTQVQRHNDKLDALAGLGWAAHKGVVLTGGASVSTFDLSDAMIALLGSADDATLLSTLGLTIGSDVQEWNAGLDDLGGLAPTIDGTLAVWKEGHWVTFEPGEDTQVLQANSLADGGLRWIDLFSSGGGDGALPESLGILGQVTPAADRLPYFNSATSAAVTPLTAFGRSLIDDVDAAHARTTLGIGIGVDVQAYSTKLDALAGMTWAANKGLMSTGSNAVGTFDLTPFARTFLDDADAATVRATLGLTVGEGGVVGYTDSLAAIGALTPAADKFPYFTGGDTADLADLTPLARNLLADTTQAEMRATIGIKAPRGYLSGFGLHYTGTFGLLISPGECRDDTDTVNIASASDLTQDFSKTGAGGLAGSPGLNSWYHVFVIMKADGTVSSYADPTLNPTLPTGYVYKRRIGSVRTDNAAHITQFTQYGDSFRWKVPTIDVGSGSTAASQAVIGTPAALYTMNVPPGVKTEWYGSFLAQPSGQMGMTLSDPDSFDPGADWVSKFTFFLNTGAWGQSAKTHTNTSQQIRCSVGRGDGTNATVSLRFNTFGWNDRRGQDD